MTRSSSASLTSAGLYDLLICGTISPGGDGRCQIGSAMRKYAVEVDTDDGEVIIVSAHSEPDAIREVSDDCESRGLGALDVGAVGLVQVWEVR